MNTEPQPDPEDGAEQEAEAQAEAQAQAGQETQGAHDELARLRDLWARHGRTVALGTAIALLVVAAFVFHRRSVAAAAATAGETLLASRTPADLEVLIKEHRSAGVVPLAVLRAAKLYYDTGDFAAAQAKYAEFREKFPEHDMSAVAVMGEIACMEARGQAQEALTRYGAFAADNPAHYLAPQAILGQSRCLEQLGRLEEARRKLADFAEAQPDSGWTPLMRSQIKSLDLKIAREKQAAATDSEPAPGEPPGA